jgi:hypothetical protein
MPRLRGFAFEFGSRPGQGLAGLAPWEYTIAELLSDAGHALETISILVASLGNRPFCSRASGTGSGAEVALCLSANQVPCTTKRKGGALKICEAVNNPDARVGGNLPIVGDRRYPRTPFHCHSRAIHGKPFHIWLWHGRTIQ